MQPIIIRNGAAYTLVGKLAESTTCVQWWFVWLSSSLSWAFRDILLAPTISERKKEAIDLRSTEYLEHSYMNAFLQEFKLTYVYRGERKSTDGEDGLLL
jgi:hypothetical protein